MTSPAYHDGGFVGWFPDTRVSGELVFDPADPKLPHEAKKSSTGEYRGVFEHVNVVSYRYEPPVVALNHDLGEALVTPTISAMMRDRMMKRMWAQERQIIQTCTLADETTAPDTLTFEKIAELISKFEGEVERYELPLYIRAIELGLTLIFVEDRNCDRLWIGQKLFEGPMLIGRNLYVPERCRRLCDKARMIVAARGAPETVDV